MPDLIVNPGMGCNMGYVVQSDKNGKPYAQTVKIDPGFAFSFLENFTDVSYRHDPRQRDVRYAPGKMAKDQVCILRYDQLHPTDQREFAQTSRRILEIPRSQFKQIVDQVVCADGFTRQQADELLNQLLARKSILMAAYAPEVSETLQDEVRLARDQLLAVFAKKTSDTSDIKLKASSTEKKDEQEVKRLQPELTREIPEDIPDLRPTAFPKKDEEEDDEVLPENDSKDHKILGILISPDTPPLLKKLPEEKKSNSTPVSSTTMDSDTLALLDAYEAKTQESGVLQSRLVVDQTRHGDHKTQGCLVFQVPPKNPYFTGRSHITDPSGPTTAQPTWQSYHSKHQWLRWSRQNSVRRALCPIGGGGRYLRRSKADV